MQIKINGAELPEYPIEFEVTIIDVDDGETTVRTADASLHRDRIAVKRQIRMAWGLVSWDKLSSILQLIQDEQFDVYYPDPQTGAHTTKSFYVSNRPSNVALPQSDGSILWKGLSFTLIEM